MTLDQFLELYDSNLKDCESPAYQVYWRASRPKFAVIVERLLARPPKRLLEIGTCIFSQQLRQLNPDWEIHTLDLTEGMRTVSEAAGVTFHQGDVLKPLPTPLDYFDTIIFSEVIEHLQGNPRLAFRHLREALCPGGQIILTTPNLLRLANRLKFMAGITPVERIGPPEQWAGHFREYSLAELVDQCTQESLKSAVAQHSMHWESVELYLTSGARGFADATGEFYYRPRFTGWKKPLGYLYGYTLTALAQKFPRLRHGLMLVAER